MPAEGGLEAADSRNAGRGARAFRIARQTRYFIRLFAAGRHCDCKCAVCVAGCTGGM